MGHKKSKFTDDHQLEKDFTVLTISQIQHICQQTNLIDKEVCRRHTRFLKISTDGRMIKEQFTSVLKEFWTAGNVQNFANYLFNLCDKDQNGFIDCTGFILLTYQLNDDKFYLGLLFDMFDIHRKGFLSRNKIEPLFAAMFELIGRPADEESGAFISHRQVDHLIQILDENKNKRLSRDQFINMKNTNWMDEDNGIGTLLVEHPC